MIEPIKVGMADLKAACHPAILTTLGLGSCIGIALYDYKTKTVGLAHIMLPSSQLATSRDNRAKFADTGIANLISKMIILGANRKNIVAKIAGGAQMFAFGSNNEIMQIGLRNYEAACSTLSKLNIPIVSCDVGGNYGRTIELASKDGSLLIKSIGHGIKYI
jgi:chemotaxis protein CheD